MIKGGRNRPRQESDEDSRSPPVEAGRCPACEEFPFAPRTPHSRPREGGGVIGAEQAAELERLHDAAVFGHDLGLQINAGHGLHLENVQPVARLPFMTELNIGHAIVARALFVGMKEAVAEMRRAMRGG